MTITGKITSFVLLVIVTLGLIMLPPVSAQIEGDLNGDGKLDAYEQACLALKDLGEECDTTGSSASESKVMGVVKTTINIMSLIIGIGAVIVIIVAGFRFVLSGGDANSVTSARAGIIYALIGLAVVVLAQTIVRVVLSRV